MSHTTYTNLVQTGKIVAQHNFERVPIVSAPPHMKRAVTMTRDLGLKAPLSPTSRYITWKSKMGFLLHETYFCASYQLRHVWTRLITHH